MLYEKTIKYTDYNGLEREEKFYFNISKSELMKLNFEMNGNLRDFLQNTVAKKDVAAMGEWYRKIILLSYGEVSPDGKRFMKNNGELAKAFEETPAFDQLYTELLTSENGAVEFFQHILPSD